MADPIYAIGDIHGQLEMLHTTLEKIERDGGKDAKIVFLGDYVDRGENSKAVVELLMNGVQSGKNWTCLLGNHDRMFTMFLEDYPRTDYRLKPGYDWFHKNIGGIQTMAAYGVEVHSESRLFQIHEDAKKAVPQTHLDFLTNLRENISKFISLLPIDKPLLIHQTDRFIGMIRRMTWCG